MFRNRYMAHALGALHGFGYLNNEEAFLASVRKWHRYFEVDLTLTEDGHVMPAHGWTPENAERCGLEYKEDFGHMTRDLFLKQKVHGMPVMDIETLYGHMKKHPEFFWQLDLHTLDRETAAKVTRALINDLHNDRDLLDRLLIQANSSAMFEGIDSVYHFRYYQLFVRKNASHEKISKAVDYCVKNGFVSLAVHTGDVDPEVVSLIHDAGLKILVYTVNKRKRADDLFVMGVDTICTDRLSPKDDLKEKIRKLPVIRTVISLRRRNK
ncbi:MAG: hypothetical protein IJH41_05745 [Eubacterium sp.]|nr:hypothetical protein [Eubacterium sp.]